MLAAVPGFGMQLLPASWVLCLLGRSLRGGGRVHFYLCGRRWRWQWTNTSRLLPILKTLGLRPHSQLMKKNGSMVLVVIRQVGSCKHACLELSHYCHRDFTQSSAEAAYKCSSDLYFGRVVKPKQKGREYLSERRVSFV